MLTRAGKIILAALCGSMVYNIFLVDTALRADFEPEIAAAAAVMVGIAGWSLSRPAEPKDTFDDPYLAYAAVEQALMKTSAKMQTAAQKVYETETVIDQLTNWK